MDWATSLPLLLGDLERETLVDSINLAQLPKSFSFSKCLSPQAKDTFLPLSITQDNKPLSSTDIINLALNEEGKILERGKFYSLPDREDRRYGHACDLVFVADRWTPDEARKWENANWEERLKGFKTNEVNNYNIAPDASVVAICARILQHDDNSDSDSDLETGSTSNFSSASIGSYSSISDPAFRPGSIRYSRPMQDQSTYILLYKTQNSKPLLCHSAALEHPSLTLAFLTPEDLSETFDLEPKHTDLTFNWHKANDSQLETARLAAQKVRHAEVKDNKSVVEMLFRAVYGESRRHEAEKNAFGRVTRMWQELLNQVETPPYIREIPAGWPSA